MSLITSVFPVFSSSPGKSKKTLLGFSKLIRNCHPAREVRVNLYHWEGIEPLSIRGQRTWNSSRDDQLQIIWGNFHDQLIVMWPPLLGEDFLETGIAQKVVY